MYSGLLVPSLQIVSAIIAATKFEYSTCWADDDDDYNDNDDDAFPSVRWCDGVHFVVASPYCVKLMKLSQKTPLLSWRNPLDAEEILFCSFDGVHLVSLGECDRFILDFLRGQLAVLSE